MTNIPKLSLMKLTNTIPIKILRALLQAGQQAQQQPCECGFQVLLQRQEVRLIDQQQVWLYIHRCVGQQGEQTCAQNLHVKLKFVLVLIFCVLIIGCAINNTANTYYVGDHVLREYHHRTKVASDVVHVKLLPI